MTLDDAAKIARDNNPQPKHYRLEAETGVLKRPLPEIPESTVEVLSVQKINQEWLREDFLVTLKDGRQTSFAVPRGYDYQTKLEEALRRLA